MDTNSGESRFLANVSHEFRKPLDDIIKTASLALGAPNAESRAYLKRIGDSADVLSTLVNDLLDLSRLDSGRLELESLPFGLRDLVTDTVRHLAPQAERSDVALSHSFSPGIADTVIGDPGRLRQVLGNLIEHAIELTHDHEVRVNVTSESRDDNAVTLRFDVDGIAAHADALETALEPFRQDADRHDRRHNGTKLGLVIAAEVVKLMGGRIGVHDGSDGGSRISLAATFGIVPERHSRSAGLSQEVASELPVIIVAGTVEERRSLVASLSGHDMATVATADVESALAAVNLARERGAPAQAVVIAGGDDPFEESRRFIERRPDRMPIVVVVSSGQRGDASRCRKLGIAGYLARPLAEGDLADTVAAAIASDGRTPPLITRHWLREGRKSLRILVADDGTITRLIATRTLEARGHSVATVENGLEALNAVETESFDVVLMDVLMPVMNGLEATEAIRAAEASRGGDARIPIIAITAHAMEADRQRCLDAGMDDYLLKPHTPEDLLAVVERLGSSTPVVGHT